MAGLGTQSRWHGAASKVHSTTTALPHLRRPRRSLRLPPRLLCRKQRSQRAPADRCSGARCEVAHFIY